MATYDVVFITTSILLLFFSSSFLLLADGNALARYPAVFNFGDSNSDTGGLAAGVGFPVGFPYGQTYFHKPSGRFSDGRLIVDFLMDDVKLPFLRSYLDSVGAPNFKRGANFATGGSTIVVNANAISPFTFSPFTFGVQVAQFVRFKARVLELLATGNKKLRKYLPEEDYFYKGLYMFDIGQNDLFFTFIANATEDQVIASIPNLISEFKTGIEKLYNIGARNFWIHNTGPLGCLATVIAQTTAAATDQFGCLASRNRAAAAFNTHLNHLCTNLKSQFPDINLTYVDIYSVKLDLIANYSRYGFKEPIAACCGYGGPPLNFDIRVPCGGATVNINGSAVTANVCNRPSEYVNWDGVHYTDAADRFVAQRLISGKFVSGSPFAAEGSELLSASS
ncbi:GDSL esterase/lipase At1g54790 [Linum perenne]